LAKSEQNKIKSLEKTPLQKISYALKNMAAT